MSKVLMQQKNLYKKFKENYRKNGARLFTRASSNRTRKNGLKLKDNRFGLDSRKNTFTVRLFREGVQGGAQG